VSKNTEIVNTKHESDLNEGNEIKTLTSARSLAASSESIAVASVTSAALSCSEWTYREKNREKELTRRYNPIHFSFLLTILFAILFM